MRVRYLAIDPGNKQSGWIYFTESKPHIGGVDPILFGTTENKLLRSSFANGPWDARSTMLLIEAPKPRGMPTAGEEMEMMIELGKFLECWDRLGGEYSYVFRQDVKLHLCGTARAKDKNVNQAIRDRFGGEQKGVKCPLCNGKGWRGRDHIECPQCDGEKWERMPGPLAGVTGHVYAALAVGLWFIDHGIVHQRIINPNQNTKGNA